MKENISEANKRINDNKVSSNPSLDLSGLELNRVPDMLVELIGEFGHLRQLILKDNRLITLPAEITQLINLEELNVCNNSIKEIPTEIGDLINLKNLVLQAIYLENLPNSIEKLKSLETLDLSHNSFSSLPLEIQKLENLSTLILDYNNISVFPEELCCLENLKTLTISNNSLLSIPNSINQYKELTTLDLSNNLITGLPSSITSLFALKTLDLSHNLIARLPPNIEKLVKLEKLNLRYNRIRFISNEVFQLPALINVDLTGNWINGKEGRSFSKEELIEFEAAGETNPYSFQEARLILVGSGAVGKTTLKHLITRGTNLTTTDQTRGIEIDFWPVQNPQSQNAAPVDIDVWDFGGQVVYDTIHQVYLAQKAIYVLVYDTRRGLLNGRVDYWLDAIRIFGKSGPIIIIENQYGKDSEPFDFKLYQSKYNQLVKFIRMPCKPSDKCKYVKKLSSVDDCGCPTCQHLSKLLLLIKEIVFNSENRDLIQITNWDPPRWKIKKALDSKETLLTYPVIQHSELINICMTQGMSISDAETFITELHRIGHILHFKDSPKLSELVVINPSWTKSVIYQLVDDGILIKNQGVLRYSELRNVSMI